MKPGDIRMENMLEGNGVYLLLRPGFKERKFGSGVATWHVLVLDDETWESGSQLELSENWLGNATYAYEPF